MVAPPTTEIDRSLPLELLPFQQRVDHFGDGEVSVCAAQDCEPAAELRRRREAGLTPHARTLERNEVPRHLRDVFDRPPRFRELPVDQAHQPARHARWSSMVRDRHG